VGGYAAHSPSSSFFSNDRHFDRREKSVSLSPFAFVVIGTEGRNPHHLLSLSLVPKGEIRTICFRCHWYRREKSAPFAFVVIGTEGRNPHHLLSLSLVPKEEIRTICFSCHWYRRKKSAPFALALKKVRIAPGPVAAHLRLMAIAFPALAIAFR